MKREIPDAAAYSRIVDAFKTRKEGATPADLVSLTGLPLEKVREFLPVAADEFGARLRVTESGEILYSFPSGFQSRYTGFGPTLRRVWRAIARGLAAAGKFLFKIWIVAMLIGYFMLFMAIALAALVASVAVSASGSRDDRSSSRRGGGLGGLYLASRIFDLVIRLWFYSEIAKSVEDPIYGRGGRARRRPARKPLHQAVFSFVFGDGDPNADWETRERKSVLAYIQANKGVISLPEFMMLTGRTPEEAERDITSYMVEFGGTPEATDDGTVVYKFTDILRRSDTEARQISPRTSNKRLFVFSSNPKGMNGWFIGLNVVNALFGSYFLFHALTIGPIVAQAHITDLRFVYKIALDLFSMLGNPVAFAAIGLGLIPLSFAVLFFAVPALRYAREKKANEEIKTQNLRKEAYSRAWESPTNVRSEDFTPSTDESRPENLKAARERFILELGSYSQPDVAIGKDGVTEYAFPALAAEKQSLAAYRNAVDPADYNIGKTIFDSHR